MTDKNLKQPEQEILAVEQEGFLETLSGLAFLTCLKKNAIKTSNQQAINHLNQYINEQINEVDKQFMENSSLFSNCFDDNIYPKLYELSLGLKHNIKKILNSPIDNKAEEIKNTLLSSNEETEKTTLTFRDFLNNFESNLNNDQVKKLKAIMPPNPDM